MFRVVQAEALESYRLALLFSDGVSGVVDLSDVAGRGVLALWNDYERFREVRIGDAGEVIWADSVDLCPDSLYLKVSGKEPEEVFPALQHQLTRA